MGGPGATFWMILCGLLGMASKIVSVHVRCEIPNYLANRVWFQDWSMYYHRQGPQIERS
ncbi:alanine:cation symporter family protein [Vibrio chagasii]|nr:alanine:cation symporter family protein [Vibrio chagasii]